MLNRTCVIFGNWCVFFLWHDDTAHYIYCNLTYIIQVLSYAEKFNSSKIFCLIFEDKFGILQRNFCKWVCCLWYGNTVFARSCRIKIVCEYL